MHGLVRAGLVLNLCIDTRSGSTLRTSHIATQDTHTQDVKLIHELRRIPGVPILQVTGVCVCARARVCVCVRACVRVRERKRVRASPAP